MSVMFAALLSLFFGGLARTGPQMSGSHSSASTQPAEATQVSAVVSLPVGMTAPETPMPSAVPSAAVPSEPCAPMPSAVPSAAVPSEPCAPPAPSLQQMQAHAQILRAFCSAQVALLNQWMLPMGWELSMRQIHEFSESVAGTLSNQGSTPLTPARGVATALPAMGSQDRDVPLSSGTTSKARPQEIPSNADVTMVPAMPATGSDVAAAPVMETLPDPANATPAMVVASAPSAAAKPPPLSLASVTPGPQAGAHVVSSQRPAASSQDTAVPKPCPQVLHVELVQGCAHATSAASLNPSENAPEDTATGDQAMAPATDTDEPVIVDAPAHAPDPAPSKPMSPAPPTKPVPVALQAAHAGQMLGAHEVWRGDGSSVLLTPELRTRRVRRSRQSAAEAAHYAPEWMCAICGKTNWLLSNTCRSCQTEDPLAYLLTAGHDQHAPIAWRPLPSILHAYAYGCHMSQLPPAPPSATAGLLPVPVPKPAASSAHATSVDTPASGSASSASAVSLPKPPFVSACLYHAPAMTPASAANAPVGSADVSCHAPTPAPVSTNASAMSSVERDGYQAEATAAAAPADSVATAWDSQTRARSRSQRRQQDSAVSQGAQSPAPVPRRIPPPPPAKPQ